MPAKEPAAQLSLAVGSVENRNLFSRHFLEQRFVQWPEYLGSEPRALFDELQQL